MPASFGAFWEELFAQRRLWTGFGDVGGNILLFLPLGAAGVLCAGADRFNLLRGGQLLAGSAAFAFTVQVLQVFEPTRNPALSDVFWNALGIGIALVAERHVGSLPRPAWPRSRLAVALVGAWVTAEWWPFVPSPDWYAIKQTLRPLVLVPRFDVVSFVYDFVSVLVLGMALESSMPRAGTMRHLALLVLGVLAGKLVFQGASLSLSFLCALVAGVAAWSAVSSRLTSRASLLLLAALIGAYTLRSLAPLELRSAPAPFRWIPFQALLEGSMDANVRSLVALLFVFGAMLWLVERGGARPLGTALALAIWVGMIEAAQTWIVGRTPDITPPLLMIGLALVFDRLLRAESSVNLPGALGEAQSAGDPRDSVRA